jgi:uncharacterized protein
MTPTHENQKTATEIFLQLHDYVLAFDADGQAELFHEHGVWEFPFATGLLPKQIVGREAIRQFGKMVMRRSREKGRRLLHYSNLRIHPTTSAGTIIAEFDLIGEITAKAKRYSIPFIQFLQVADSKILVLRD